MGAPRAVIDHALRSAAHGAGEALRTAQGAWRRHVFSQRYRSEITTLHKSCCSGYVPPLNSAQMARRFLADSFDGYSDLRWHEVYWCVTGMVDSAYIPDDLFYLKIEPALNAMPYVDVLTDKNGCYNLPVAPHLPEPVLHLVRGDLYRPGFVPVAEDGIDGILGDSSEKFIVKPSTEHGGGRSLQLMDGPTAASFLKDVLRDGPRDDANWLVQRRLEQCAELAHFNPPSVNCYRIMTMRVDGEAACIMSYLRVGGSGMPVDNFQSGGLACSIEHGKLRGWGVDRDCRFHRTHPANGIPIGGELPAYGDAIALCQTLHRSLPWFDLVAWDIAIDRQHRPRIIEFNVQSLGIRAFQMAGGPLFGPEGSAALAAMFGRLTSEAARPPPAAC